MSRELVLDGCTPQGVCYLLKGLGFVLTRHETHREEFPLSSHTKVNEWWEFQSRDLYVALSWFCNESHGDIKDPRLVAKVSSQEAD
jgi:hypothetical protein